jgi:hypothetical protein
MTIKSTKLALILTAALSVGAPLALSTTPADAAPGHGGGMQTGYHDNGGAMPVSYRDNRGDNGFSDRDHRPPQRDEMRMRMPHRGFHWHAGNWNWQRGHWVWVGGFWNAR